MSENPELKLSDLKEDDKIGVDFVQIIENKFVELDELHQAHLKILTELNNKKNEINKQEESIQYELSGINGAKIVLKQILEEAKDS
jgi:hypothetical protein